MDIAEILMQAPMNFTIQDALTKCNSMVNNQHQHILCTVSQPPKEVSVIKDMLGKCDLWHKVDFKLDPTIDTYDLIIGSERAETSTSFTMCAGDGLYRPCFWMTENDLDEYIEYYNLED